jgi:hypothetical protein
MKMFDNVHTKSPKLTINAEFHVYHSLAQKYYPSNTNLQIQLRLSSVNFEGDDEAYDYYKLWISPQGTMDKPVYFLKKKKKKKPKHRI